MTYFWKSDPSLDTPDLQTCQAEVPKTSAENAARFDVPEAGWTLFAGVVRPKSRGSIRLTGPSPTHPVKIHANMLAHPDDLQSRCHRRRTMPGDRQFGGAGEFRSEKSCPATSPAETSNVSSATPPAATGTRPAPKQQGAAAGDFRVVDVDTVLQCMHAAMSQAPQWCAGLSDRAQRKAVVNLTDTLMMLTGPR